MFGDTEMTRGNLSEPDRQNVIEALTTFSELVAEACTAGGLGRGQIPFVRPSNFVAVLDIQALRLVVDDTPIGAIPDHTYIDERQRGVPIPLNALVGRALHEFGFRQPVGISLPIAVLEGDKEEKKRQLQPLAEKVCAQLLDRAEFERLNLPPGFQYFVRFFPEFLQDHPDIDRNVFLMMRFKTGEQYEETMRTLRQEMAKYGLKVLRADDKDYTGDLWDNVCLYMLGSRYGVAVFEEIDKREFNPSVALELGFMLAQNKRCLILKDQRMTYMPTDILGKLYKEFDTFNIETSIRTCVESWARDIGLR